MKYRIKRQSRTPFDKVHEECGVFGIAAPEGKEISAAHDAYTALFALQHPVSNFVGKTAFAAVNLIMPVPMLVGTVGFMLGTEIGRAHV